MSIDDHPVEVPIPWVPDYSYEGLKMLSSFTGRPAPSSRPATNIPEY
jgi:hypothetical protein